MLTHYFVILTHIVIPMHYTDILTHYFYILSSFEILIHHFENICHNDLQDLLFSLFKKKNHLSGTGFSVMLYAVSI